MATAQSLYYSLRTTNPQLHYQRILRIINALSTVMYSGTLYLDRLNKEQYDLSLMHQRIKLQTALQRH
jgi:hypothetical protein